MTLRFEGRVQNASLRRVQQSIRSRPARIYPKLRESFRDWSLNWTGDMTRRLTGPASSPGFASTSDRLARRSGFLGGNTRAAPVTGTSIDTLEAKLQTQGVKYARLQQNGGVVRPRNARFLTIPTPANLYASGRPQYPSARQFISEKKGETFFLRTEAGGRERLLLMWDKAGRAQRKRLKLGESKAAKATAVPMFVLVRQVELPGPKAPTKKQASRFGFFEEWTKRAPERQRDLARIARALGGGS